MKKKPLSTKSTFHLLNQDKENPVQSDSLMIGQRASNLGNFRPPHSSIMKKQSVSTTK
jgi:hypothetical protein